MDDSFSLRTSSSFGACFRLQVSAIAPTGYLQGLPRSEYAFPEVEYPEATPEATQLWYRGCASSLTVHLTGQSVLSI